MEHAHSRASDWPGQVRSGLGALLGRLAEAPACATTAILQIDAVGPAGRVARETLLARFRDFFTDLPDVQLPFHADELIDTVVGGAYSAIYRRITAGRTADLPDLLPGADVFLSGSLPRPGTRRGRPQRTGVLFPPPPGLSGPGTGHRRQRTIAEAVSTSWQ
ncbi:hypothetical protein ABZZ74_46075 [Streptomyces sp. NPDC006476]|uniref:hypothetical protein n=1 Tax=Streptomyces sp. NPDC006476 TaxID=3157175 RepID=UPI0033B8FB82